RPRQYEVEVRQTLRRDVEEVLMLAIPLHIDGSTQQRPRRKVPVDRPLDCRRREFDVEHLRRYELTDMAAESRTTYERGDVTRDEIVFANQCSQAHEFIHVQPYVLKGAPPP